MKTRLILVCCAALALTVGVAAAGGATSGNVRQARASAAGKGPDPLLSSVTVDRTAALANGVDAVRITITARDSKGRPVAKWNAAVLVSGALTTVVQAGQTDKNGVATAELRSTDAEAKLIRATLWSKGTTVTLAQTAQVEFFALRAIEVQVYQSRVGAGDNCFRLDRQENLPGPGATPDSPPVSGGAWSSSGDQPKGGYTTWVRAVGQSSEAPYDWEDLSGSAAWSVLDPQATGTTLDPATGRVTTGAGSGTVHFVATFAGLASPADEGTLAMADAGLTGIHINPADDEDKDSSSFGPSPIYVAAGNTAPAGVTGTFTDASDHCITWDTSMSSNNTNRAVVDTNGVVTGVSPGTATVTARKGATISAVIPVNVGLAEVIYLEVLPREASMTVNDVVQLGAKAHYTDGSSAVVTATPGTTWFVDPISGHLVVSDSGLVANGGSGVAGDRDSIRACLQSDFIRPDGVQVTGTTCSDASFNVDAPQYPDPLDPMVPANYDAVVTIS